MSTPSVLDTCTPSDLRRFAACYLSASNHNDVNWDLATSIFDPTAKIKVASFKTVTVKAVKKVGANGTSGAAGKEDEAKGKAKGGRKRKVDFDGEREEGTAKKLKGGEKKEEVEVQTEAEEQNEAEELAAMKEDVEFEI